MNTVGGDFRSRATGMGPAGNRGPWTDRDFSTAGQRLRARREALGIPIEAIARKTKMPRRTVELLEADEFDTVGAEFYVRGFIKLYAEHLGMRVAPLLEAYETQTALHQQAAASDLPNYFQTTSEPARSLSPAQIFLLVACAATVLVFMLSVQKQRGTRVVAKRPAISAPGTPATAERPATLRPSDDRPAAADAIGN